MKPKYLGVISLTTLLLTAVWLVPFIWSMVRAGPVNTFDQALANAARLDTLFYLSYLNAALLTIVVTVLYAGLYAFFKSTAPEWSVIGLVFMPVYCAFNLFAYLSQITIVPALLELSRAAESQAAAYVLLQQLIQQWPGSAVGVFNNLAYAILGIPSIIFGVLLYQRSKAMRLAGTMLALNGAVCIVGIAGILLKNPLLSLGSAVGGAIFFFALIPLSLAFFREAKAPPVQVRRRAAY